MSTLGIALLGSKFMGKAHSNAWAQVGRFFDLPMTPRMEVAAARDAAHLATFAARWGWQRWTTNWEEAVSDPEVAVVDVATPNRLHHDQALAALEAGKHVACEKPLAATLTEAREMAHASASAPGKTFVWFNYRRVPAVALAKRLIDEGLLGRIYHLRAAYLQSWGGSSTALSWRFSSAEAGSGALGDLGAHAIDLARFLTGDEFEVVTGAIEARFIDERPLPDEPARTGESTVDDAVVLTARMSGGAVATIEATRLATGYENANRIEIHGEQGAVRFDFERMNELGVFDGRDGAKRGWRTVLTTDPHHPYMAAWWPAGHPLGYEHTFVNQAADMVAALAGLVPTVPLADFADAYQTQRVMEAAVQSARRGSPVTIAEVV